MAGLPIRDQSGNVLTGFRAIGESRLSTMDSRVPLAASFVVVVARGRVLMIFDSWRRQWELPGGTREDGETPRWAAVRELREETGIESVGLDFAGVAEFELRSPPRREYVAVYRTGLRVLPRLIVNDEAIGFLWWDPRSPVEEDMSPLDAEIGRRVVGGVDLPKSGRAR